MNPLAQKMKAENALHIMKTATAFSEHMRPIHMPLEEREITIKALAAHVASLVEEKNPLQHLIDDGWTVRPKNKRGLYVYGWHPEEWVGPHLGVRCHIVTIGDNPLKVPDLDECMSGRMPGFYWYADPRAGNLWDLDDSTIMAYKLC